tara:strand:- start:709 stop:1704 length:996 start_codon:yes stop_codon:yes gene_type:complete
LSWVSVLRLAADLILFGLVKARTFLTGCSIFCSIALGSDIVKASPDRPDLVAFDGVLCDLVKTVASKSADVYCVIPPTGDPHYYRLKPKDLKAIANADIVFHNGFYLTPSALNLSTKARVIAIAEEAMPAYKANTPKNDQDPHVWHDPNNVSAMVTSIEQNLINLLPQSELATLNSRTTKAKSVLNELSNWSFSQVKSIPANNRVLLTQHRAFSHLTKRYGLRELPVIDSFATGGTLRPSSLAKIVPEIEKSGSLVLFTESLPVNKTLKRLSRSSGVPIYKFPLYPDGLAPGGLSTIETATSNICVIAKGQGSTCDQKTADQIAAKWANIR